MASHHIASLRSFGLSLQEESAQADKTGSNGAKADRVTRGGGVAGVEGYGGRGRGGGRARSGGVGASGRRVGRVAAAGHLHLDEVGAVEAGRVVAVHHDGFADQTGLVAGGIRHVRVVVAGREWAARDVAVLARQIAHLAGGRLRVVTRWDRATHVRIQMRACRGAVAVRGDRHGVDVVD